MGNAGSGNNDTRLMSMNALEDGWNTECFNEQARAQLKTLGKLVTHFDEAAAQQVETLLVDECWCSDLRPGISRKVYDDGSIHVL